jgi:hypothetical protein
VPFSARDVAEFAPHWVPIAKALAPVVRFVIWDQVRIEVGASRTVHFKAPGQSGK